MCYIQDYLYYIGYIRLYIIIHVYVCIAFNVFIDSILVVHSWVNCCNYKYLFTVRYIKKG